MSSSVRPIPDADAQGLHERFLDVCARQVRVAVRFRVSRTREVGIVVGIVGAVDHHARIIVGNWSDKYNVPIADVVSVEELDGR